MSPQFVSSFFLIIRVCLCRCVTCYLLYACATTAIRYATLISCWAPSHLLLQHQTVEKNLVKRAKNLEYKISVLFITLLFPAAVSMRRGENRAAFQARSVVLTAKGHLGFPFTSFEPPCLMVSTSQVYWSGAAWAAFPAAIQSCLTGKKLKLYICSLLDVEE